MTPEDLHDRLIADWRQAAGPMPRVTATEIAERAAPEQASRVAVLAELEDLRLSFTELHGLLDDQAADVRATSRWTARDVVAHLASWAMETRREAETLLAGGAFDYSIHFEREGGPRAWNQQEVDARARRTPAELFDELDRETIRTMDLMLEASEEVFGAVATLPRTSGDPAEPWRMPLGAMVLMSCWHARLHLRALEELLRKPRV
ncbi:MAG: hypothetical protein FJW14_06575 [Acidimicrobiia bacterium]|nr:hypothetical protein [Acidimicrobiia bacterium]